MHARKPLAIPERVSFFSEMVRKAPNTDIFISVNWRNPRLTG
ncbi:hypothetical protein NBRC3255_1645 [Gluconobacter thailandicus NBRC 3255]|nr:hypothetical protein NBRC3255_1645 [Gluconobacter thailandicus NBRC 3255]